jgi:4-amino-4-deoxy-L-arabinose transferase-like glycosyltransferase
LWLNLIVAGVMLGLALLVKNYALLAVALAGLILMLNTTIGHLRTRLCGTGLLAGIALLIALPWYAAMARAFGNPFFVPSQPGISRTVEWFAELNRLPWYTYLAGIPYQVPLFVLGYVGVGVAVRKRQASELPLALWLVGWLVALTWLTNRDEMLGPEQRYMLPAYPALAVLSALVLEQTRRAVAQRTHRLAANALVIVLVLAGCLWSLRIAFRHFASGEIVLPF